MGYQNDNNHLSELLSSPLSPTDTASLSSSLSSNDGMNSIDIGGDLVGTHHHSTNKKTTKTTTTTDETTNSSNKSSLLGAYANLVNTIVGAGIIGIPYAIKETGLVTGVVLIIMVAIFTDKSMRLLVETGKSVNVSSYETLMETAFGYSGFVFITLNMFVLNYGALICYLLIIKDTIPTLLFGSLVSPQTQSITLLFSSLFIILPLSMQKDMADLSKTSTMSVFFDIIMVLIIAIFSPVRESIAQAAAAASSSAASESSLFFTDTTTAASSVGGLSQIISESILFPKTVFVGLGVLSFAFVCQDSSFLIAGSFQNPTKKRWSTVTRSALLTCSTLATIIGVTGYLGFRENTEGNILNNFSSSSSSSLLSPSAVMAANVARGLLGSTMFCIYPLASYIARHSLLVLLFPTTNSNYNKNNEDRNRVTITLLLYISAIVPALLFNDVGIVLSVTGAIGGSCLSYLGPGAVYLGIHGDAFLALVTKYYNCNNNGTKFMLCFPQTDTASDSNDDNHYTKYYHSSSGKNDNHIDNEHSPLLLSSKTNTTTEEEEKNTTMDRNTLQPIFQNCHNVIGILSWYMLAMPIWCWIAHTGRTHRRSACASNNNDVHQNIDEEIQIQKANNKNNNTALVVLPRWNDYLLAITYMLIGIVALIAGLISIYVS